MTNESKSTNRKSTKNCPCMDPAAAVITISTLAAAIAQGKTKAELDTLAVIFAQLGDTLATISLLKGDDEVIFTPLV